MIITSRETVTTTKVKLFDAMKLTHVKKPHTYNDMKTAKVNTYVKLIFIHYSIFHYKME